jgi:hypothetical protein
MGQFCRICGRLRPNEKFSGRGHRQHVCKDCQRMPREKRDRIERLDELLGLLDQSHISDKNVKRLKTLALHPLPEVRTLAALVLDIARAHPFKRRRWRHLVGRHRDLFDRAVAVLGFDFFEQVLLDYGDTGGRLWEALEARTG